MDDLNNLDPVDRRQLAQALEHLHFDNAEGIRIAEERLAMVERGEARMVPWDEAMRMLGRGSR
jgi:hypothetical protein